MEVYNEISEHINSFYYIYIYLIYICNGLHLDIKWDIRPFTYIQRYMYIMIWGSIYDVCMDSLCLTNYNMLRYVIVIVCVNIISYRLVWTEISTDIGMKSHISSKGRLHGFGFHDGHLSYRYMGVVLLV